MADPVEVRKKVGYQPENQRLNWGLRVEVTHKSGVTEVMWFENSVLFRI